MIRRGLSMAMIMVLATLALAVPGTAARSAPNAEVVPQSWLVGHLKDPDARGIVAVDGADFLVRARFTLIGLRPGANHRIVLSGHPCGLPAAPASSHAFTANSKGQRSAAYKVTFEDILISSLRSVRVRVQKSGGYQTVACAALRLYDLIDQQASTVALREHGRVLAAGASEVDTLVTIFREPEAKGIIVHGNAGNDEIRVRAVVTGLAASQRHRLIGGAAGCDHPWATSERIVKVWIDIDRTGAGFFDMPFPNLGVAAGDVNGDGVVDAADLAAWRFKRASGRSVGCYEVDARLARH